MNRLTLTQCYKPEYDKYSGCPSEVAFTFTQDFINKSYELTYSYMSLTRLGYIRITFRSNMYF